MLATEIQIGQRVVVKPNGLTTIVGRLSNTSSGKARTHQVRKQHTL